MGWVAKRLQTEIDWSPFFGIKYFGFITHNIEDVKVLIAVTGEGDIDVGRESIVHKHEVVL
jgi:hypothetical protein